MKSWLSFHVYYHESLDRVLKGFVYPAVSDLAESSLIESFFFIRYGLGGPHVRLRLKTIPGATETVAGEVGRAARDFLKQNPSTKPLDEEVIRRVNQSILASDSHEEDDSIFPDNSFHAVPFRPEIRRYGGPELFQLSLDFFALSSVAALEFVFRHNESSRSSQLAAAFRLLLQQALGFSSDEAELADLLRYGVDWMGASLPKIVEKGDVVAGSQMDAFLDLFGRSMSEVRSLGTQRAPTFSSSGLLFLGARRLSAAIVGTDRGIRAGIGGSQLHMTATRLGLGNPEEVYLSRLLTLTLAEARIRATADLSWVGDREEAGRPGKSLQALVPQALAVLRDLRGSPLPSA